MTRQHSLIVALTFVVILILNPFFRFTAGRAWNHDLAVLATVAGFVALLHAANSERGWLWIAIGGVLLGIAVGTRVSFAPLVAPFALITLLFPARRLRRSVSLAIFLVTVALALIPTALLWLTAPSEFLFGTFIFNARIDALYEQSVAPRSFPPLRRLVFPGILLLKSPSDLALVAGFAFFGLRPLWRDGWRKFESHRESAALALLMPFLFLGAWAPPISYAQYYYVFVPFLLLVALGVADIRALAPGCKPPWATSS